MLRCTECALASSRLNKVLRESARSCFIPAEHKPQKTQLKPLKVALGVLTGDPEPGLSGTVQQNGTCIVPVAGYGIPRAESAGNTSVCGLQPGSRPCRRHRNALRHQAYWILSAAVLIFLQQPPGERHPISVISSLFIKKTTREPET